MVNLDRRLKLRVGRRKLRARKSMARKSAASVWVVVSRSNRSVYAQALDTVLGKTLVGVSTRSLENVEGDTGTVMARRAGETLGAKLVAMGVSNVAFDRRGLKYHGRVAAVAEGLRVSGVLK